VLATTITVTPQIDGAQVGPETAKKSLWTEDGTIYVSGSNATHHRDLAETIVSKFLSRDIREAIRDSIGRDPSWIEERFGADFVLGAVTVRTVEELERTFTDKHEEQSSDSVRVELIEAKTFENETETVTSQLSEEAANHPETASGAPKKEEANTKLRPLHDLLIETGFEWNQTQGLYANPDTGEVVKREPGSILPWAKFSRTGTLLKRFLETSSTLKQGIDLKAEAWMLFDTRPDLCCIVGPSEGHNVFVLEGDSLKHLRSNGRISVAATGYRLRVEGERQSED
jgi:hypothetical protein